MSTRINLTVENKTDLEVKCTDISCKTFSGLSVGDTIAPGKSFKCTSDTNDRIFCEWAQESPGSGNWQLAMTCPKSSDNSACGSNKAGLHTYNRSGTPVSFTFSLSEENRADWNHGDENHGECITYGDCS